MFWLFVVVVCLLCSERNSNCIKGLSLSLIRWLYALIIFSLKYTGNNLLCFHCIRTFISVLAHFYQSQNTFSL